MQNNILDIIITEKKKEVEQKKISVPLSTLRSSKYFNQPVYSLSQRLSDSSGSGIIAEFKRKSPSKGFINEHADVNSIVPDYAKFGAAAVSVLTDKNFFGAQDSDFEIARSVRIPILRKDFIIDEFQVWETRAMGADIILLIAACLSVEQSANLSRLANELGLEILLEIHDETELKHINKFTQHVGINNRNLKTFKVDLDHSERLASMIPGGHTRIAESGIDDLETVIRLKEKGFNGFLIGEKFMKADDPGRAFAGFAKSLAKSSIQVK